MGSVGAIRTGPRRLAFADDPPMQRENDPARLGRRNCGEGEPVGRLRGADEHRLEVIVVVTMLVAGDARTT